jgi:hypothetical protein
MLVTVTMMMAEAMRMRVTVFDVSSIGVIVVAATARFARRMFVRMHLRKRFYEHYSTRWRRFRAASEAPLVGSLTLHRRDCIDGLGGGCQHHLGLPNSR